MLNENRRLDGHTLEITIHDENTQKVIARFETQQASTAFEILRRNLFVLPWASEHELLLDLQAALALEVMNEDDLDLDAPNWPERYHWSWHNWQGGFIQVERKNQNALRATQRTGTIEIRTAEVRAFARGWLVAVVRYVNPKAANTSLQPAYRELRMVGAEVKLSD